MEFEPINKATISGKIVEQVKSMIHSGNLEPGSKIPSERVLTRQMKVGRSSIREAMKSLEALGLIRRTNAGTIICKAETTTDPGLWLSSSQTKIFEVFETRKIMEIELASLAAKRGVANDIKKMEQTLLSAHDAEKIEIYSARDISFHQAIADAGHNSILSRVYQMVSSLLFQTHKYHLLMQDDKIIGANEIRSSRKRALLEHKKILGAIKSHDIEGAKRIMKRHLDISEKILFERVKKRAAYRLKRDSEV